MLDAHCHLKPTGVDEHSLSKTQNRTSHRSQMSNVSYGHEIVLGVTAERGQTGGANFNMKFQRIWFRNAQPMRWLPHLDRSVIFPNRSYCRLGIHQVPITHQGNITSRQTSVRGNIRHCSCCPTQHHGHSHHENLEKS
jgi:hypothetical protein